MFRPLGDNSLDLVKGYYQVEMFPDDMPKTSIITDFSGWENYCCIYVRAPTMLGKCKI